MYGFNALIGDPATYAARNTRRWCFYTAPSGAAPLTGLLSLVEPEMTDGPEYDWFEERIREKVGYTVDFTDGSAGPWQDSTSTGGATIAFTAGYTGARLTVRVTEVLDNWQVGERIRILRQRYGTTSYADVYATITAISQTTSTTGVLTLTIQDAITVNNTANTDEGMLIQSMGAPNAEGARSPGSLRPTFPVNPGNYTQIWKTPFAFSRTEMNQPMLFDEQGLYRSKARRAALAHMIEIENSILFGQRSKTNYTMPDGTPSVVRTTGSVKWFLQEYEKVNGGTFTMRPGGVALTANTDDGKRIIQGPATGILSNSDFLAIEPNIFKTSISSQNDKLVLGGAKFIAAWLKYYRTKDNNIRITRPFDKEPANLNFSLTQVETDYGNLYFKTHPRFTDLSSWSSCGYILDLSCLKFRPMRNADTHLQENIGERDFDGRKDQYLTEGGLEMMAPEAHMYFENVSSIATS